MVNQTFPPCPVCRTRHYNACPVLWGGSPERPDEDADAVSITETPKD